MEVTGGHLPLRFSRLILLGAVHILRQPGEGGGSSVVTSRKGMMKGKFFRCKAGALCVCLCVKGWWRGKFSDARQVHCNHNQEGYWTVPYHHLIREGWLVISSVTRKRSSSSAISHCHGQGTLISTELFWLLNQKPHWMIVIMMMIIPHNFGWKCEIKGGQFQYSEYENFLIQQHCVHSS